jgi:hypothetical protein
MAHVQMWHERLEQPLKYKECGKCKLVEFVKTGQLPRFQHH